MTHPLGKILISPKVFVQWGRSAVTDIYINAFLETTGSRLAGGKSVLQDCFREETPGEGKDVELLFPFFVGVVPFVQQGQ